MSAKLKSDFKCPDCNTTFQVSRDPELEGRFAEMFSGLVLLCDECAQKRQDKEEKEREEARAQDLRRRAYGRSYLPVDAETCTFKNSLADAEALNPEHWAWANGTNRDNIWACGPPGVGKSWLSYCILNRTLNNGYMSMAISGPSLSALGRSYHSERDRVLNMTKHVQALLIDDIDKARWQEDGITLLWEVLDARQRSRKQTIITSNQAPEEFIKALRKTENTTYIPAILDRLNPCHRMVFQGASLRSVK